jgi:hypothetical protein
VAEVVVKETYFARYGRPSENEVELIGCVTNNFARIVVLG